MQSHYQKCLQSQHKMFLSSIFREFILKKRTLPQGYPRFQVHQNEIYITCYELPVDRCERNFYLNPKDLIMIIDQLTKKIKLHKIKGLDSLSLNLISYCWMRRDFIRDLTRQIAPHFPGLKNLALNFYSFTITERKGIEEIAELISSFKNLESLEIRFASSDFGPGKDLNFLVKKIHQSQRALKKLSIDASEFVNQNYDDLQLTKTDLVDRQFHEYSLYSSDMGYFFPFFKNLQKNFV